MPNINLKGTLKWVRVHKPEEFQGNTFWSLVLYPDEDSLEVAKELQKQGVRNHIKNDGEGDYITFKRHTQKEYKGKIREFDAPWLKLNGQPFEGLVGNGSKGEVNLDVYSFNFGGRPGKAVRLEGVNVTELVEYNP